MRILYVNKKPGFLAEVAKQDMPNYLCRAFTPGLQRLRVSTKLEDEAILTIDFLLPYASSIRKHTSSGSRIKPLKYINMHHI